MEVGQRVFYAVLGVLSLALLGLGVASAGVEGLAFGFFAALVLGGGLVCLWERSVVRSAFALLANFGGVAGLFLLLGSDFLAVVQILIYVGGILALILFGVMLSPPDLRERKVGRVLGGLGVVALAVAWVGAKVAGTVRWSTQEQLPEMRSHSKEIGIGFLAADQYVVAFELAAVLLTVALVAAVYIARRKASDLAELPTAGQRGDS